MKCKKAKTADWRLCESEIQGVLPLRLAALAQGQDMARNERQGDVDELCECFGDDR